VFKSRNLLIYQLIHFAYAGLSGRIAHLIEL